MARDIPVPLPCATFTRDKDTGALPAQPHGVPLPPLLSRDFGVPKGLCHELSGREGVPRHYSVVSRVRRHLGRLSYVALVRA